MNVPISFSYTEYLPEIQRHFSVIGKRTYNNAGDNIFSKITLSSAETPILTQYMQQASQNVVAAIEQFVSAYVESATGVTFNVTNTRWNDPTTPSFVAAFDPAFKKYVVMYTVAEYLSMNFPELAKKYFDAALQALQAIIRLVFFKAPPAAANADSPSSDITQRVEFTPPLSDGVALYFEIPKEAVIGPYSNFGNLRMNIIRDGEELTDDDEVSVAYYRTNNTPVLGTDTTPAATNHVLLPHDFGVEFSTPTFVNRLADYSKLRIKPYSSGAAIASGDILLFTWTETSST